MKVLKYAILTLTFLNIPTAFFFGGNQAIGSVLSYLTYGLLLVFLIVHKGGKPNVWLLLLGLSYFLISGVNLYSGIESDFFITLIKYLIAIFAGSVFVKHIKINELLFFLIIGTLSIIVEAAFFSTSYGRYGGLYINANLGGFVAILAYTLTFNVKKFYIRTLFQVVITICGIITFSRTFLIIWVLINLISMRISVKNVRILAAGFGLLVLLPIFGSLFKLNTTRLNLFTAVVNQEQGSLQNANEASRTETWAIYYPYIADKPFFGNGYNSFQSTGFSPVSVHNAYLLILGEAGLFPFVVFLTMNIYFLVMGVKLFKQKPFLIMQGIAFALFMLTFHNFFTMDFMILLALWIFHQIRLAKELKAEQLDDIPQREFLIEN
ncbi:O-antigen ligase family protein [Aggregatimonas sangjinii]|uniref:O-antigen ligase family protein n=1 Tax=Aggregatimonas sangjinii TaxID=2583587 RepID=A0A5B7SQH5_9FLAO|nr:O-antigen ligase family protein [Aggregatimonas sangjinii]QCW99658.1 O-antigen ligase family protein [Aggregatimonas sangjinii]